MLAKNILASLSRIRLGEPMASQWRVGALILLSVLLAVGGCAKEVSLPAPRSGLVTAGAGGGEGPQRFVATRHRVEISTTEKQLPKVKSTVRLSECEEFVGGHDAGVARKEFVDQARVEVGI